MSMKLDILDIQEAEHEAHSVITRNKITTLPVCPFQIAEKAGIVVQPKESDEPGVSGFLMRVGNVFGIQYATHIPSEGFIRFTVAHELGHYFLPGHPQHLFPNGDGLHRSRSGFFSGDRYERQADHFASALLMPETFFRRAIDGAGQGFPAIQQLANLCRTSITATSIRYATFSEDVVAVVVSSGEAVEFCVMSDRLKQSGQLKRLNRGDLLPVNSTTAKFNSDPENVRNAQTEEGTSYLDDWFDGAPQIEMNEDVVGLGTYGKSLTVLFTENDFEEENDEFDDD